MTQPEDNNSLPYRYLIIKGNAKSIFDTLQAMAEASEKAKCRFVSCMILAHALACIPLNPDMVDLKELKRRMN